MSHVRILLVDDHEVVRVGLKALLNRHPNFEVIAEAASGEEAIEKADQHSPDVVLMDIRLAGTSGIDACAEVVKRQPNTKVIMLTSYAEDEMLFAAIRAGATDYMLKRIDSTEMIRRIEAVAYGTNEDDLSQRILGRMRNMMKQEEQAAFADLTPQEKHVLALIVEGKTNREIAQALFLSEGTVRNYVSSILSKLGVSNRAEAAAYAMRHHLEDHL